MQLLTFLIYYSQSFNAYPYTATKENLAEDAIGINRMSNKTCKYILKSHTYFLYSNKENVHTIQENEAIK